MKNEKNKCTKMRRILAIIAIVAVIVFLMVGCEEDKGPLGGTKWVSKVDSSIFKTTATYSFNDSSKGNYSYSGQEYNSTKKRWENIIPVNRSFTYVYSEKDKKGSIDENDNYKRAFTISGNTMTVVRVNNAGTNASTYSYTRQ